jgi:hypothetical protein
MLSVSFTFLIVLDITEGGGRAVRGVRGRVDRGGG